MLFPTLDSLKRSFYLSAGRAQVLKSELDRLDGALSAAGVPYLPLKGAALAWSLYPDPALRPMHDLDLLVEPAGLLRAVRAAQSIGYRLDKLTNHAVLTGGPDHSIPLELHWCLPGGLPLSLDLPNLSNDLRSKSFERFTYLYCQEHLLRQHGDNPRLIWRYDLHLLEARLRISPDFSDTQFAPDNFATQSQNYQVINNSLKLLPKSTRLRLLGALFFPSPEYMRWRYRPKPGWTWPAYYPKRMADWVARRASDTAGGK